MPNEKSEDFEDYEETEAVDEEQADAESILTEYDSDDFVSGAVTSPDSTLPDNLFQFEYSYGYNCQKYFNLCACDDAVVCWAAGSMVTFMDVDTKQTWFRRSTTGGTVGAITSYRQDPRYRIAIAEAGEGDRDPIILLYTWPQMEIDAVLRDGTTNAYSILDFSPDGELLASVGKEPDYNLTIWNWRRHTIMLRTSAFTFDVHTVVFSPYCPGQLTTAGAAHIKFWKMARTFTGLKLQGELGRFGGTEICDVVGVYPMPDEKVLSGCEWGNILVWEAGLVKVEVTRRGRKSCHAAPIVQFMLSAAGDEVTTVARDGCVRAWYWDTVEQADPPEDDPYVELNPVADTCVPGCQIMCLKHQKDHFWYAQDGNGGIWTVDLELDRGLAQHTRVVTAHAGGAVALAALRTRPLLLSAGADGALLVHHTRDHALRARCSFDAPVTCLLYPPLDVDPTSSIILLGFAHGVMRTLLLNPDRLEERVSLVDIVADSTLSIHSEESPDDVISLISFVKPHSAAIRQICINEPRTLLVTSGDDATIFLYALQQGTPFTLHPLGYIETPSSIQFMTWKPDEDRILLLCGAAGLVLEAELPRVPPRDYDTLTTYKLDFVATMQTVLKKHSIRNRPVPTEEDLASLDEEALKAREEADDDDEEWIGEIQLEEEDAGGEVTWAQYCGVGAAGHCGSAGDVWVAQRGAGALLLLRPGASRVHKYAPLPGAWTDTVTVARFVCEGRYIVLGTDIGYIRAVRLPTAEEDAPDLHRARWDDAQIKLKKMLKGRRLAKEESQPTPCMELSDWYYLAMHDRYTGALTAVEFSPDAKQLYTSGADGNIFSFDVNFPEPLLPRSAARFIPIPAEIKRITEPSSAEQLLSHEQLKRRQERDKLLAAAAAHTRRLQQRLAELAATYTDIVKANKMLPWSQQVDVVLDARPLAALDDELTAAAELTRRRLAHPLAAAELRLRKMHARNIVQLDVFPFTLAAISDPSVVIRPLRQKNLSQRFYDQLQEVHQKMAEAAMQGRNLLESVAQVEPRPETAVRRTAGRKSTWGPPKVASFLLGLPPRPPHPLKKALRHYHQRLNRHHHQFVEWQEHLLRKPDPLALPAGAAQALRDAELSVGNRVLKTQPEYVAPPDHDTQLRLCRTRQEIYETKHEFNEKVVRLREWKVSLVARVRDIRARLTEIHAELPPAAAREMPQVPTIDEELEFPEKNLEVKPEVPVVQATVAKAGAKKTSDRKSSGMFPQPRTRRPRVPKFVPITESKPITTSWELLKPNPDEGSSAVEIEIRERRLKRHLFEQDVLLAEAQQLMQQFDSQLRVLQRERIRVQERNQLLELHLYQLHREMNVLNRFEANEHRLADRVYEKLVQVQGVQEIISDLEGQIEELGAEKEGLGEDCQQLHAHFKKLVQDNAFADFLRRIFKKKYRPPRDADEEESSESESDSSSSEEDEGSMDSRDIGPIRLDPNVCPEGCDQELYNQTFELRNNRHGHEQRMIEIDHTVDVLRKDIDAQNKLVAKFSQQLEQRKKDLKEFMMEKQSCLNEISQVVVVRYGQVRATALRGAEGAGGAGGTGLARAVLFPARTLHALRRRVTELQGEIHQQRERQKVNRTHVFRMRVDMRAMEERARALAAATREALAHKLGEYGRPRRANAELDELLRQMARRHKFRAALAALPPLRRQIREWKERHERLEKEYLDSLNHYSDRLRLAAALQADVLPHKKVHEARDMVGGYEQEQYERDVVRLRIVRARQLQQITALEQEIKSLRLKPLSPAVVPPAHRTPPPTPPTLKPLKPSARYKHKKYFPITSLDSSALGCDAHTAALVAECVRALDAAPAAAPQLLRDLTTDLPEVVAGNKSRFEVVEGWVKKWVERRGGGTGSEPRDYRRRTRAFDALAKLADKMIQQHIDVIEGAGASSHRAMAAMERAISDVADARLPLHERLGPALATLLHATAPDDIAGDEAMTSLVRSLTVSEPITMEALDLIQVAAVVQDIKDCGVEHPDEELGEMVQAAVGCLRAQHLDDDEHHHLRQHLDDAFRVDVVPKPESLISSARGSSASKIEDNMEDI
ncbi:cilia- and flagella-associated protein 44 isoform X2 [Aricia agestis]|uniref:cilia- and flagella-associated protein 44 isoform X2 n=1 Tax=Aricia agestis TaxID=91739 RepID=UPI001C208229|nr:cilia- and flagella-associated protein 44 isoform X2 [Aricia agestis]